MRPTYAGLRPSWIAFGWFIAAALTALVLFVLLALGVISDDPATEGAWVALAFLIGFALAGFLVGARAGKRPVLHGLGIGLFSLVVWVAANLLLGEPTGQTAWGDLSTRAAVGLLLLQTAAAVVGARMGTRWRGNRG